MNNIRRLRSEGKNKEALELAINYNRDGISDSDLITLLDEIIITSWYDNKKNIGVNASLELMKIYNRFDINLSQQVKDNILFVLPEYYEIDISKIPYFTTIKELQSKNIIYIENYQKLYNIPPPFIIFKILTPQI
jgi:hypothetical protein